MVNSVVRVCNGEYSMLGLSNPKKYGWPTHQGNRGINEKTIKSYMVRWSSYSNEGDINIKSDMNGGARRIRVSYSHPSALQNKHSHKLNEYLKTHSKVDYMRRPVRSVGLNILTSFSQGYWRKVSKTHWSMKGYIFLPSQRSTQPKSNKSVSNGTSEHGGYYFQGGRWP